LRIDNGDFIGSAHGNVEKTAVRCQRKPPCARAYRYGGEELPGFVFKDAYFIGAAQLLLDPILCFSHVVAPKRATT